MTKISINPFTICITIITSHLLVSCSLTPDSNNPATNKRPARILNKIDDSAITFKAKYGTDYQIHGNVIAKYPHFNLTLFSQETIRPKSPNETNTRSIYLYELTSKDGFGKTHITCDPRHPEKKHFYLEGLHFYYHSNSDGTINIYMPPQLLARR